MADQPTGPTEPTDVVQAATDLVVATQTAGLQLLEAEMIALVQMVPGAAGVAAAQPLPTDEEIEEGFDNLPV